VIFREAVREDLPAIVAMLADDMLGKTRESPVVDDAYERAFAEVDADPRSLLVVAEDGGEVVACMQVVYLRGLGRHGAERALVEAVRVRSDRRGLGLGSRFITWAVEQARARGCAVVQLTSDRARVDAHRFYASLGFVASHVGMKLVLTGTAAVAVAAARVRRTPAGFRAPAAAAREPPPRRAPSGAPRPDWPGTPSWCARGRSGGAATGTRRPPPARTRSAPG
jgi:GNAT superfamily N-acetyltransferase